MTGNADPRELDPIPIAQLEPSLVESGRPVYGVVTLIWPYSTSNKSFSLLLAEPDFRLRHQNGQVRIHFTGSSAKVVSGYNPQSGDNVILNLVGAQWEKDETASKTPGRGIEWQIRFSERATLRAFASTHGYLSSVALSFHTDIVFDSATPTPNYDPFDEDEFRDNNRRKKTKFGRGNDQWRFTERSTSSESGPDMEPPEPEMTTENDAPDALVNGHEAFVEAQGAKEAGGEENTVPEEGVAATPSAPVYSTTMADSQSIPQLPLTVHSGQHDAVPVPSGGAKNAMPITVDEGVQTLRTGSEPLEEPHAVEEPANSKEAVEDVSVSIASDSDPALQGTQRADQQAVVDLPSSPGPRADDAKTPEIPPGGKRESVRIESQEEGVSLLDKEAMQHEAAEKETSSPIASSQSLRASINASKTRDKSLSPSYESAEHGKDVPEEPPVEYEMQELPEARAPLETLSSGVEIRKKEVETAQNDILEIERTTDVADQANITRYRDLIESPRSASQNHDQAVSTNEQSRTIDRPIPNKVKDSYHDNNREQVTNGPEPISLPSDGPRSRGDEDTPTAATLFGNNVIQNGRVPQVLSSDSESGVEEEEEADLEFFSDDEEQQWDPEEEEIMEKERQRVVEESKSPEEGWSSEEEDYPTEHAPGSELSMDDEGEDVYEAQQPTQITRSSQIEVIDIVDTDEEENAMAQSQIDGAAMSILPGHRRRSLFAAVGLPSKEEEKLYRSSHQPLPDTVPDSQPFSEVVEREVGTEDARLQIDNLESNSAAALQPNLGEVSQEEDHLSEVDIHAEVQDGHTKSLSPSHTKELAIEEHIDPRLKSKVLTPNDTQQRDQLSQASAVSLRSVDVAHDLPTPQLTQNRSSDILLPASLRPLSPIIPSSSPPASQAQPSTPVHKKDIPLFVDALRELGDTIHALPKPSSKSRRVSNIPASVSPWFAPRISNEIVPRDSEAESEDDDESVEEDEVEAAATANQQEEDEDEEIPSSMPEAPAEYPAIKHQLQPSFTPGLKSTPPPPTGLRTSHDYYAPLSTLPSHFDTQTSTLSIVLASTPITRASSGPRDFYTTIMLTDPSSLPSPPQPEPNSPTSPTTTTTMPFTTTTIFRPTRSTLPSPLPSGSVLLLRSFTVTHSARAPSLLSSDSSAWAVFPPHTTDPAISGPPIEFGAEERGYVRGLWEWWDQVDASVKADVVGKADDRVRKAVAKEERERKKGRRLKGMGLRLAPGAERGRGKGWEVRHELRDGKEWVDKTRKGRDDE
ncbi:MAG: hypothetical protein LQ341_002307 [Variospora aurantia]|nr:MAG: hypothetical protein LQ341_002307 [Variospora aurantia]